MTSSDIDSCLYWVPYHSSVLSVCPSNDLETTATLKRNRNRQTKIPVLQIRPLSVYRHWYFPSLTASLGEPDCRILLLANLLYSKWLAESGLLHYMWEAWVSSEPSIQSTKTGIDALYLDRNAPGQLVLLWSMEDFQNNDPLFWVTKINYLHNRAQNSQSMSPDVSRDYVNPNTIQRPNAIKSKVSSTGKMKRKLDV